MPPLAGRDPMSDDVPLMPPSVRPPSDRLESWKEIARYLGKDVRTVQRWERHSGLPVHRHREARVLNVHASRAELDAWRNQCRNPAAQAGAVRLGDRGTGLEGALSGTTESASWADAGQSTVPRDVPGLIILPFRLLRPDPEIDFLTYSLPDAITNSLSSLQSVVVRSRLVAGAPAAAPDIKAIAAAARVQLVLVGTLLRSADRLRVTAQLLRVPDGTVLCSHSADVTLQDLFRIEDDLTRRIVASLPWPLTGVECDRIGRDVPANAAAYEYYLRANQLGERIDRWLTARDLYLRSLEQDPGYAPAWARLGRMYRITAKMYELDRPAAYADSLGRAEAAIARAVELNPDLTIAHNFYTALEIERGRAQQAMVRLLARAQPRTADPELFAGLVTACRYCGLLRASLAAHRRARALDPSVSTSVRYTLWQSGNYQGVVEGAAGAYDAPLRALCLLQLARDAEATAVLEAARAELDASPLMCAIVALLLGLARRVRGNELARTVERCTDVLAPVDFDPEALFGVALMCARAGDHERAVALLERAVTNGFVCHPSLARESWLDPLRGRADFGRLLRVAARGHEEAKEAYLRAGGERVLGVVA
jgi:TolB-like protein